MDISKANTNNVREVQEFGKSKIIHILNSDTLVDSHEEQYMLAKLVFGRVNFKTDWKLVSDELELSVFACKLMWRRMLRGGNNEMKVLLTNAWKEIVKEWVVKRLVEGVTQPRVKEYSAEDHTKEEEVVTNEGNIDNEEDDVTNYTDNEKDDVTNYAEV
mmetsp:Transcript_25837/g.55598  ORF Transcript_25837/g.55598 Transcript_25837/m.55598 type:complete len:159 (-) Transcript_25837:101-577(-)